jgi:hypothetical protein
MLVGWYIHKAVGSKYVFVDGRRKKVDKRRKDKFEI